MMSLWNKYPDKIQVSPHPDQFSMAYNTTTDEPRGGWCLSCFPEYSCTFEHYHFMKSWKDYMNEDYSKHLADRGIHIEEMQAEEAPPPPSPFSLQRWYSYRYHTKYTITIHTI
jgi:hypothetical protein